MGRVVVQYDTDDGVGRIMRVQAFQQGDELTGAMSRFDVGDEFAAVQIQRGQNRQGAITDSLRVA